MLRWRVGRATAIAGGLVGMPVAVFASVAPLGAWDAAAWSRALVVPLALLLAATLALRARAGPNPIGRLGWGLLVGGVALGALAALALLVRALEPAGLLMADVARFPMMLGALLVGAVAGARRAIPRAAGYAMVLAPVAMLLARALLGGEPAASVAGLGLALLIVGARTID